MARFRQDKIAITRATIRGMSAPSVLFAATGFDIAGGIAAVNRTIRGTFDAARERGELQRVDYVRLLADFETADPNWWAKASFIRQLRRQLRDESYDWVLFDLVGLARAMTLPIPEFRNQRFAIFTHWHELTMPLTKRHHAAMQSAEVLLTNSQFSAGEFATDFPQLRGKVRPVPLCIEPRRLSRWNEDRRPFSDARKRAVLIVSRIDQRQQGKGHRALLAAWPDVVREFPDAELWIVGDGSGRQLLEQQATGLNGVSFLGMADDDHLHELYSTATVYAMPSEQEGFGLVYAEAMWHGMPCIGSSFDAASELIVDGETGWIIPYDDPVALREVLLQALSDPDRCARMGAAGRRRVEQEFDASAFEKRLFDALELT